MTPEPIISCYKLIISSLAHEREKYNDQLRHVFDEREYLDIQTIVN